LTKSDADGEEQQKEISRIASQDAYNWGYDPVHYGTPEGSYSTNPDTGSRNLEYRQMVQARFFTLDSTRHIGKVIERCFATHATCMETFLCLLIRPLQFPSEQAPVCISSHLACLLADTLPDAGSLSQLITLSNGSTRNLTNPELMIC
jgi:hypothetical protein